MNINLLSVVLSLKIPEMFLLPKQTCSFILDLHHKNIPEKSVKIFRINLRGAVFKQQTPHTAVDKLQLKKAYSKFNKNIINNTIKTPTILFY